jgi:hypothetical protein
MPYVVTQLPTGSVALPASNPVVGKAVGAEAGHHHHNESFTLTA